MAPLACDVASSLASLEGSASCPSLFSRTLCRLSAVFCFTEKYCHKYQHPSVVQSAHLSICPCVYPSLSVCPSITCVHICVSIHLSIHSSPVYICVYLSICPSTHHLCTCVSSVHLTYVSVQFSHSVVSDCLQPRGLQHTRLPCPTPTPEIAQTHVHQVGDASNHLILYCSPSPPAFNLS